MEEKYNKILRIAKHITLVMRLGASDGDSEFREYVAKNKASKETLDFFSDDSKLAEAVRLFNHKESRNKGVENLKSQLLSIKRRKRISLVRQLSASVAAVVAITATVWVGYVSYDRDSNPKTTNIHSHRSSFIVVPTLILDNGTNVRLDKVSEITEEKYDKLIKVGESKIGYNKTDSCDYSQKYNTLIVPCKFIYSIELSDGTNVVLNAQSKLIYPVVFNNKSREVILEGEGFFDVAKSDIPFCVKSRGVNITVYGTKFNVNNYTGSKTEVVLLSGSVGVSLSKGENVNEHILKPNQLINISAYSTEIIEIKSEDYASWRNGVIKSYDAILGDLVSKMSNWYGVDIEFFEESKRDISITASFDNKQPIENIISAIEHSVKVKFVKNERGYTIY